MHELEETANETAPCLGDTDSDSIVNMQNGTEPRDLNNEKLNGIQPADCPSSDQSSLSSRARGVQGGQSSSRSGSISTVKDFLNSSFNSPELEQMYQNYFSKRKRTTVVFLLGMVIVYNFVFLAVSVYSYTQDVSRTQKELLPRIIFSVIVIVVLGILFVLYNPRLLNLSSYSYLPGVLWVIVFLELIVDLLVSYMSSPHIANYSLGLYIFFIYVTYSMIRFHHLYACIIVTAILTLFHAVAVGVMTDDASHQKFQIVANFLLMVAAMIIGVINYLVTDINQRRSFLDTRENVESQLAQEKEEKNQKSLLQSVLPSYLADDVMKKFHEPQGTQSTVIETSCFKDLHIKSHEKCSILFADIVGFTEYSSTVTAENLIIMLNELFANFDKLAKRNMCQRIKILGDCYYCISGLENDDSANDVDDINHAENSVEMGLAVVEHIKKVRQRIKVDILDMRVGIHSGHVLAGIIGQRKWQYDVWSNDVTLANKMESGGLPGRVHVSEATYGFIKESYSVEEGNGGERSGYLKEKNVTTYLIKDKTPKLIERWRSATMKRNSTLKKQEEQAKKYERGSRVRIGDNSPLDKISNACGRASTRISIDNLPAVMEEANSTKGNEFISLGVEPTDDTDNKTNVNQDEIKIHSLLKEALSGRNSELTEVVNAATLIFKNSDSEKKYQDEKKQFCLLAFITLHVCSLFGFVVEMILRRTKTVNFITFAISFVVLSFFWVLTGIGRYTQNLPKFIADLSKRLHYHYPERTAVTTACVLILLVAEIVDVVCTSSLSSTFYNPMFFSYNGVLILLVVCTLIQLPYIYRIALLLITAIVYPLLFFLCIRNLYDVYDATKQSSPLNTKILLTLQFIFYFVALFYHSYQSEKTARVLMLWKKEASEKRDKTENLKKNNEQLMQNILPQHVIDHFLNDAERKDKDETDLYSKSYKNVGVIFASVPNFSEFYSEDSINKDGIECMRVLNEIISDFDEVLRDSRFACIEKIKTISSCYMAASNLDYNSTTSNNATDDDWQHLVDLTNFGIAIKGKLNEINAESFNNFALRVGIAQGPVVAGVIGAKKPHYDIWGNTVNIASRMESTGQSGTIQVLSDTYEILKNRGFLFKERGYIYVKGKGELLTYILVTEQSYDYTRPQRPEKNNKENLEVNKLHT